MTLAALATAEALKTPLKIALAGHSAVAVRLNVATAAWEGMEDLRVCKRKRIRRYQKILYAREIIHPTRFIC